MSRTIVNDPAHDIFYTAFGVYLGFSCGVQSFFWSLRDRNLHRRALF